MFSTNSLQAYIHSRMRRRTADFLQGNSISYGSEINKLTVSSPPKSATRKRRKGEKDGQWTHFQGSGKLRGILMVVGLIKYKVQNYCGFSVFTVKLQCLRIHTLWVSPCSSSKAHSSPANLAVVIFIHAGVDATARTKHLMTSVRETPMERTKHTSHKPIPFPFFVTFTFSCAFRLWFSLKAFGS